MKLNDIQLGSLDPMQGGPAFPGEGPYITESGLREPQYGMSLRDYFAAKAMQGILSRPDDSYFEGDQTDKAAVEQWRLEMRLVDAKYAYEIADAMLAIRAKVASQPDCKAQPHNPAQPDHDELLAVLDLMERYGGGFVQALAVAWRKADPINRAKLYEAFSDYYHQYAKQLQQS